VELPVKRAAFAARVCDLGNGARFLEVNAIRQRGFNAPTYHTFGQFIMMEKVAAKLDLVFLHSHSPFFAVNYL
jgi:hypothetical protein